MRAPVVVVPTLVYIVTVVRGLSLLLSSQRHRPTRHHSGRRVALERLANRGPLLVVVSGAPFYAAAYVHVQAAAHNARLETEVPTFADLRYFILLE